MLTPTPGVAGIERHKLTGTVPSEKELRDIAKDYKIAEPLARRTLKRRNASGGKIGKRQQKSESATLDRLPQPLYGKLDILPLIYPRFRVQFL
jgi:hypothetical protein